MSNSTNFSAGTIITHDWLNNVNSVVFSILADASTNPPTTKAQCLTNIGGMSYVTPGNSGNVLTSNGTSWISSPNTSSGSVTTVSFTNANGFTGTVTNPSSTPAIQIAIVPSGVLKGSSGALVGASSGVDFAPATSGSAILKGNGSGGFSNAVASTDYAPATSGSSILKGNGTGGFANAVSSTDYAPATSGSAILKGNGTGGFSAATSGTDYSPATTGTSILKANGSGAFANAVAGTDYMGAVAPGANGNVLTSNGSAWVSQAPGVGGTVTSVSVVTAHGFSGTVATATTTPAITLNTTITGVLKGDGTSISAAASGTDFAPATSGTSILKGSGSGGFANAVAGTDYAGINFANVFTASQTLSDGLYIGSFSWINPTNLHSGWASTSTDIHSIISTGTRTIPYSGQNAGLFACKSTDAGAGAGYWTLGVINWNNSTSLGTAGWCIYGEMYKEAGTGNSTGTCIWMEAETINRYGTAAFTDPYNPNAAGLVSGIRIGMQQLGPGGEFTGAPVYNGSDALSIGTDGASQWQTGILFQNGGIVNGLAIAFPKSYKMQWYSGIGVQTSYIRCDGTTTGNAMSIVFTENTFKLNSPASAFITAWAVDSNGIMYLNTATYGSAGALAGYFDVVVQGTTVKIPYYLP